MSALAEAWRRFARDDRGAAAAEFALVVPVFLMLVFGTISVGLAMSAINQIHYAAERSARCLSVDEGGNCTGDINVYAKGFYHGPSVTALNFAATSQACGNRVIGTAGYEIVTGFSSTAINISATACYPEI